MHHLQVDRQLLLFDNNCGSIHLLKIIGKKAQTKLMVLGWLNEQNQTINLT